MSWDEFSSLLAGISPDTVLGRVVAVRSETDPQKLKYFTSDQKRIWEKWQERGIKTMSQNEFDLAMKQLEMAILAQCR